MLKPFRKNKKHMHMGVGYTEDCGLQGVSARVVASSEVAFEVCLPGQCGPFYSKNDIVHFIKLKESDESNYKVGKSIKIILGLRP
ncbi:hypothetical protein FKM82_008309 [Ascaphus truei]